MENSTIPKGDKMKTRVSSQRPVASSNATKGPDPKPTKPRKGKPRHDASKR